MKACSFDNNEEASHAQASGQLRFVLSPRKRAEELLRTIRNASASHLKRMYLTMEILRPCKNASQTTQVRLSQLHASLPKNGSCSLLSGEDTGRTSQKASLSATDCPLRHRINVPDLKNCMAQKSAAQRTAQLPNPSQVQYACPECFLAPHLSLQYFAPRRRGGAGRGSRWSKSGK